MEVESRYIKSLLQSAQTGNNAALEQIFEMNLDRIYTISHRLTGNQQDAETLASKTLIEAWKNLGKIRTDVPFNLWLESMNVHLALQHLRDVKEERKKWGLFKRKKIEIKEPDSRVSQLDEEICKLPKLERTAFVLSRIENYTVDELFGMMDLSSKQIEEKIQGAENILLKAEFVQTKDMLTKIISELPKKIKANKKIIKDALSEIYDIKLKKKAEEEEEEQEEPVDIPESPPEQKPERIKIEKTPRIDITAVGSKIKKKLGWVLTIITLLVAAYLLITIGEKSWEVSLENGNVLVGRSKLVSSTGFSSDEILKTGEKSAAKVTIPGVGYIIVEQVTELKRLGRKNSAELIKGQIKVDCSDSEGSFELRIPASSISNLYPDAVYMAKVNIDGSGQVNVKKGWITIAHQDEDIIAASDHYIDFDPTFGTSMPYHKNSGSGFSGAVREFLYTKSELYVEKIVALSTKRDALTLWNLFNFISAPKRILVYRKLNEFIPHPPTITNEDIISLNPEKLRTWLEEIELRM